MDKTTVQFPEFIQQFPQVLFPPGVDGNSTLIGNSSGQVVFHTIKKGEVVPLHAHEDSWAILVSGKLQITVGTDQFIATIGQSWFIPKGSLHGGQALDDALLVEVFCEERWKLE